MKKLVFISYILLLVSCSSDKQKEITQLVKEWENKEITFPKNSVFTIQAKDTVAYHISDAEYKVLVYVDTIGCTSCRLKLPQWEKLIEKVDSLSNGAVTFCFYLFPKTINEAQKLLCKEGFKYPVCIDMNDELNRLNRFPKEEAFQAFLLDKDNKVVVIGNPVHNPAVKALYLEQITGMKAHGQSVNTTVRFEQREVNLGEVSLSSDGKEAVFVVQNTGESPLVITDVVTSCGCTKVEYEKAFIKPGASTKLTVHFVPEEEGFFHKAVTVHCNADHAPFKLHVKGNAVK